jgi:AcrR family transcriptional regulator
MVRWEPGAEGRLMQAAYELYLERGYERVTVAEIAERAGLTKRTFFRYFTDKREVLFSGASEFQETVVSSVVGAPEDASPIDAVAGALTQAGAGLAELGDAARQRQRLIDSSTDLREREMIKMAALTAAIGGALRQRGVLDQAADLTAQAGITVFKTAFERWARREGSVEFPPLFEQALNELRVAIGPLA